VLAYLFWHRPKTGVRIDAYEEAQRAFHRALAVDSACFAVTELPFSSEPGYEDWYLVDDWADLATLNRMAVDALRRDPHDRAAAMAGSGWGGVYSLARGSPAIPQGIEWLGKSRGVPYEAFIASLAEGPLWQRQMVLGPSPEFALATGPSPTRRRL